MYNRDLKCNAIQQSQYLSVSLLVTFLSRDLRHLLRYDSWEPPGRSSCLPRSPARPLADWPRSLQISNWRRSTTGDWSTCQPRYLSIASRRIDPHKVFYIPQWPLVSSSLPPEQPCSASQLASWAVVSHRRQRGTPSLRSRRRPRHTLLGARSSGERLACTSASPEGEVLDCGWLEEERVTSWCLYRSCFVQGLQQHYDLPSLRHSQLLLSHNPTSNARLTSISSS